MQPCGDLYTPISMSTHLQMCVGIEKLCLYEAWFGNCVPVRKHRDCFFVAVIYLLSSRQQPFTCCYLHHISEAVVRNYT